MLEIGDTVHGSLLFDNKEVASVKTQVANRVKRYSESLKEIGI